MTPLLFVGVALLGLAIGSFLNVVIHRVPRGESLLRPGSHCPACQAAVRPRHNVPVLGWLALRGRCADCGAPISARYPLVELATGALFVAVTARFGLDWALPAYLYLAAVSVALAMIDIDVQRLPNVIVLPSYAVGAALLLPAVIAGGDWSAAGRGLVALAAAWIFFYALTWIYPGGMGMGDVKLAGLLGLYLGWLGWGSLVIGIFGGFLLGGLVGAALLATRRATRKSEIPFGPAMLAGALAAIFWAEPLASWYAALLTPTA